MPTILQNINMFRYEQFWGIRGEKKVTHQCGGLVTILAFVLVGAIACYELALVFQKNQIVASTQAQIDFLPAYTNITTFQDDPNTQPFMLALDIRKGPNGAPSTQDYQVYGQYAVRSYNSTARSYQSILTTINLENCTSLHFSKLPNITENIVNWGINQWYCLPINKTFQIGGNQIESSKQIRFGITCKNTSSECMNSSGMAMATSLYTLNTFINPENNTNPFLAYLNNVQSIFQSRAFTRNFIDIDKNILKTDSSLIPFENIDIHASFQVSHNYNSYTFSSTTPRTEFIIQKSGRTTIGKRSYLKLLQAFSFVGGLIPPIIALFSLIFVIKNFGSLVFEMRFAQKFFKEKPGNHFNYLYFVKQLFYNILEDLNVKTSHSQTIKRRKQITKTVNRLMDIVYLQRRISFLEKAISVLLEKHQLRGLYLLHNTQMESEQNYKNHKMRLRLHQLLFSNKFGSSLRDWFKHQTQIKQLIHGSFLRKKSIQVQGKQIKNQQQQRGGSKSNLNDYEKEDQRAQSSSKFKQYQAQMNSQKQIIPQDLSQKGIPEDKQQNSYLDEHLNDQTSQIDPIQQQQAEQLAKDLLKLRMQAEKKGEPKSKRIFELFDKKMKATIQELHEMTKIR